ncbi:hypothetical protein DNTS_013997 [Danionella cerebrum]|uniref:Uncharacterized protein n=1 Tax=Danionella cerebrum TaxID=2873325 RepID=A0A553N5J4_9TELE|nr:hypothetical protein DNTS_013997 [Danionella translucida]
MNSKCGELESILHSIREKKDETLALASSCWFTAFVSKFIKKEMEVLAELEQDCGLVTHRAQIQKHYRGKTNTEHLAGSSVVQKNITDNHYNDINQYSEQAILAHCFKCPKMHTNHKTFWGAFEFNLLRDVDKHQTCKKTKQKKNNDFTETDETYNRILPCQPSLASGTRRVMMSPSVKLRSVLLSPAAWEKRACTRMRPFLSSPAAIELDLGSVWVSAGLLRPVFISSSASLVTVHSLKEHSVLSQGDETPQVTSTCRIEANYNPINVNSYINSLFSCKRTESVSDPVAFCETLLQFSLALLQTLAFTFVFHLIFLQSRLPDDGTFEFQLFMKHPFRQKDHGSLFPLVFSAKNLLLHLTGFVFYLYYVWESSRLENRFLKETEGLKYFSSFHTAQEALSCCEKIEPDGQYDHHGNDSHHVLELHLDLSVNFRHLKKHIPLRKREKRLVDMQPSGLGEEYKLTQENCAGAAYCRIQIYVQSFLLPATLTNVCASIQAEQTERTESLELYHKINLKQILQNKPMKQELEWLAKGDKEEEATFVLTGEGLLQAQLACFHQGRNYASMMDLTAPHSFQMRVYRGVQEKKISDIKRFLLNPISSVFFPIRYQSDIMRFLLSPISSVFFSIQYQVFSSKSDIKCFLFSPISSVFFSIRYEVFSSQSDINPISSVFFSIRYQVFSSRPDIKCFLLGLISSVFFSIRYQVFSSLPDIKCFLLGLISSVFFSIRYQVFSSLPDIKCFLLGLISSVFFSIRYQVFSSLPDIKCFLLGLISSVFFSIRYQVFSSLPDIKCFLLGLISSVFFSIRYQVFSSLPDIKCFLLGLISSVFFSIRYQVFSSLPDIKCFLLGLISSVFFSIRYQVFSSQPDIKCFLLGLISSVFFSIRYQVFSSLPDIKCFLLGLISSVFFSIRYQVFSSLPDIKCFLLSVFFSIRYQVFSSLPDIKCFLLNPISSVFFSIQYQMSSSLCGCVSFEYTVCIPLQTELEEILIPLRGITHNQKTEENKQTVRQLFSNKLREPKFVLRENASRRRRGARKTVYLTHRQRVSEAEEDVATFIRNSLTGAHAQPSEWRGSTVRVRVRHRSRSYGLRLCTTRRKSSADRPRKRMNEKQDSR